MKKLFLCFSICLSWYQNYAQNLVPNPSFEDTIMVNGQPGLNTWLNNIGSPDYFTRHYTSPFTGNKTPINIRGNQNPKEGVAYFGFAVLDKNRGQDRREYLQVQLLDSLQQGEEYEIEFYLSLADSFHLALASTNIGVAFQHELQPNNFDHKVREFRPFYTSDSVWDASNKTAWQKFHYTHTANGNEKVLIIGCFLNDQDIQIDSVGNGANFPLALQGSYYYIDNISVQLKDTSTSIVEQSLKTQVQVFPNPTQEQLILENNSSFALTAQWFSLAGQAIEVPSLQNGKNHQFSTGNLPKGVYFLKVSSNETNHTFKILKE